MMMFLALFYALGQTTTPPPAPVTFTSSTVIGWDGVATDEFGVPYLDPARVSYEATIGPAATADPGAAPAKVVVVMGTEYGIGPLLAGLTPGQYRIWVRAVSPAGVRGVWSDPLLGVYDSEARPSKVPNLRKKR